MLECLKKNDIGKEYAMRKVTEKTKQERTVMSIPDKMDEKYSRTIGNIQWC